MKPRLSHWLDLAADGSGAILFAFYALIVAAGIVAAILSAFS